MVASVFVFVYMGEGGFVCFVFFSTLLSEYISIPTNNKANTSHIKHPTSADTYK